MLRLFNDGMFSRWFQIYFDDDVYSGGGEPSGESNKPGIQPLAINAMESKNAGANEVFRTVQLITGLLILI